MYKYYQAVDDPLVYWRHDTISDLVYIYISDWDDEWMYDSVLNIKDLARGLERGEAKEIDYDPVTNV